MNLAYLTTQYPKVSHSFVRREICELERRGHRILRMAIRRPEEKVVDPVDLQEEKKTVYCLEQHILVLFATFLRIALTHPIRFSMALHTTLKMSRLSDRGLGRHIAYLVEATFVLRRVRLDRIEHIHVHFGNNAATVARLVRCLGGPSYSVTLHGPDEWDAPLAFSLKEKIEDAAFVVTISSFGSAQARRWVSYQHWGKIKVVHCAVDKQFFHKRRPIAKGCLTFLFIGRLTAQKAPQLLVDAMAELVEEGIDARLVLAGDGELREAVEALIYMRGLNSRVQITGWIDEAQVRQELLRARCLVLPSFAEGLPVVIMEALAMGRPVISTYIGGIPELVRSGESGWLIPAGSVGELVAAMKTALLTPIDKLNEMGRTGGELVCKNHLLATEVEKLEALFLHFSGISQSVGRPGEAQSHENLSGC